MAAAGTPAAAAAPPIGDPLFAEAVGGSGWLTQIGWHYSDVFSEVTGPQGSYRIGGGSGVTLVLIDTGVDLANPDFKGDQYLDHSQSGTCTGQHRFARFPKGIGDGVTPPNGGSGKLYHGTTVASLAAAPINGVGSVGAAPVAKLVVIKIRPQASGSYMPALGCGLEHARAAIAASGSYGVVNVSFRLHPTKGGYDGPAYRKKVEGEIARLVRAGALLVAAGGNRVGANDRAAPYPASLPHVLGVGDSERRARVPGPWIDVAAPGSGVHIAVSRGYTRDQTQTSDSATSWSTPLVSGAAATLLSLANVTPQQAAWLLRATAKPARHWNRLTDGFGTINLGRALDRAPTVPADDELEPNDTTPQALALARTAAAFTCDSSGCGDPKGGLIAASDDPVDRWAVTVPAGRKPCPQLAKVHGSKLLRSTRASATRWTVGVGLSRVRLGSYTLRVRLCPR